MQAPSEHEPSLLRRLIGFFALVGVGVGIFMWLQASRAAPRQRKVVEQGRAVRALELQPLEIVPRTVGYGAVEAQREWQAIAEVSGLVVEVAERLEVGRVVREGTVLLKIDPGGYKLEKNRSEAVVKAVRAQIAELKAREQSAGNNLKIEERALALARGELERTRVLHDGGNAPLTDVEAAERAVIAAEKAVQGYRNTISELPVSRRVLEAQLEQQQAGVETTQMDLARTEIVAPFTMRLREVNVGLQQGASAGQVLVIGDGIDVFEIPAQVPVGSLDPLMPPREAAPEPMIGPMPAPVDGQTPTAPARTGSRAASLEAIVKLESQGIERIWKGRFRRFGGIDPATRTMLAVVEVDDPRPPESGGLRLNRGLYVEVELRGPPRAGCLAVPRDAYHDGVVHVVGAEDRLELRKVEATLVQEDFVCLGGEVAAGDRVVLTELVPAIAGTLLAPRIDAEAGAALASVARGERVAP
jgi:hypothetical protein